MRDRIDEAADLLDGQGNGDSRPILVPIADVLTRTIKTDWLIKGIVGRNALGSMYGETGAGKTFVALDMALSVAMGTEWHDRRVHCGGVAYIAAEDPSGVALRIQAYRTVHADVAKAAFVLIESPVDLPHRGAVDGLIQKIRSHYDRATELVVIDTTDACFGTFDDSKNQDMRQYIAACKKIRDELGCTVLSVMHPGHDNTDRERGGSNLKAAMDFRYRVNAQGEDQIVFACVKRKNHAPIEPLVFQRRIVELGTDEDGDPITSCVIVPSDAPVRKQSAKRVSVPTGARVAVDAIDHVAAQDAAAVFDATVIGAEANLSPYTKVVLLGDWRDEAYRRGLATSREDDPKKQATAQRVAWHRAKEWLIANRWVAVLGNYAWRTRLKS